MQIVVVQNPQRGIEKAKELLYEKVDRKTVLFLSGGHTPEELYRQITQEKFIRPVAVGMVDEHYQDEADEKMIESTGFIKYLDAQHIPFYPIYTKGMKETEAAIHYDQVCRDLFFKFPRSVAVMGIGEDGHIAGIPPLKTIAESQKSNLFEGHKFVAGYSGELYQERVTMTIQGLHLIDFFIVLVFGKDKKKALKKMLETGTIEKVPARFFNQEASEKTVVITDQKV